MNQTAGENFIQNYPNPFTDKTNISFRTRGGYTSVEIFNTLGQMIETLTAEIYLPGNYVISWNAEGLAAGNYYARLQNENIQQVRSMIKVR